MASQTENASQPIATTSGAHEGELLSKKLIQDSIHGPMMFDPVLVAIMDTPQLQRLRDIKQLGGGYFVYPGASHNRFEHSLGVCHLAGEMFEELATNDPSLQKLNNKDRRKYRLMVQIAGLCHDMGHGPFSHTFEHEFMPAAGKTFKHEEQSLKMFDYMLKKNPHIEEALEGLDITPEIIKALIHCQGSPTETNMLQGKEFLFEIVANKRTGVDVDKWDYFKRDGAYLGIQTAFDHKRLMKFCRVMGDGKHICIRDKEAFTLYEMFLTRENLHRKAYQHKTVKAVETMIVNGLLAANKHIKIKGENDGERTIVGCADDMEAFTRLTDSIFYQILASKDPRLKTAQKWLEAVEERQMYRLVAETPPMTDKAILALDNKKIQTEIENCIPEDMKQKLEEDKLFVREGDATGEGQDNENDDPRTYEGCPKYRFTVQVVNLNFGKKERNPVDDVLFYTKGKEDKLTSVKAQEISTFLPKDNMAEIYVRVLLRPDAEDENGDRDRLDCLYEALCDWYKKKLPGNQPKRFEWAFGGNLKTKKQRTK